MAVNIYYEQHGDITRLKGKQVAIIGYGSQGHAHALNLKESGVNVVVGTYEGSPSGEKARGDGLRAIPVSEAAKTSDVMMMLTPDERQKKIYNESIFPNLRDGQTLMFAHGFNIHFKQIEPPKNIDVSMIAPKAPGHRVRELFTEGVGVPGLLAIHQDPERPGEGECAGLRLGAWLFEGRRYRNVVQGRNRKRSVRRADRALRRYFGSREGGFRNPG